MTIPERKLRTRDGRITQAKPDPVLAHRAHADAHFVLAIRMIDAINAYIDQYNEDPRPIVWTKTADQIIEKVGRARLALDNAPTA